MLPSAAPLRCFLYDMGNDIDYSEHTERASRATSRAVRGVQQQTVQHISLVDSVKHRYNLDVSMHNQMDPPVSRQRRMVESVMSVRCCRKIQVQAFLLNERVRVAFFARSRKVGLSSTPLNFGQSGVLTYHACLRVSSTCLSRRSVL